ncbi:MAG: hypothetical protein GPJ21_22355 [Microcystis aeruginosa W13-11]|jgi:hypothetical protein|nr:hypothetical protein [Microcystis aeruginosa W13-11]
MTQNNPRLWQLAEIIGELETAIAAICQDESKKPQQPELAVAISLLNKEG